MRLRTSPNAQHLENDVVGGLLFTKCSAYFAWHEFFFQAAVNQDKRRK